ncbi:MAG: DUF2961 domain-containing protein [Calditrichaeota bacterium]|nr:DUF2961 domain-containing protein [Calditrichota bacterium]
MNFLRIVFLLTPLFCAWGQPYWDYMLHPERLSWPLDAQIHHFSSWSRNGSNSDLGFYYGPDQFGNQILADVEGPGVVTDMWWTQDLQTSAWRWRLFVDDTTNALIDTPLVYPFGLMSPFLPPAADSSSGGYYSYVPIPFQDHIRITYNDARDIYYHVSVITFPPGTPVESFTMPPSTDYMTRLDSLSARLSTPQTPIYVPLESASNFATVLNPGERVTAFDEALSGQTRRILLVLQNRTQSVFENFWIRVYTDGYPIPDIEGPVSAAMASPLGWHNYQSTVTGSLGDSLYFNLPVVAYQEVRIEFENKTAVPQPFSTRVEWTSSQVGPFRLMGQYREANPTRFWENYLIAEFEGAGNFVGTTQDMQQPDNHVLEGDERFFIDGETTPTWHGTGTEDYFKGGRYWTPVYTQLPLHGCVAYLADSAAAYRWHNNDPVPFTTHLKYDTEVGRFNNLSGHYRTMGFAYVERPQWKAVDASGDHATHSGETLRIIGKSLDPLSPIYGTQMGDEWLGLADGALLSVNGDSVFDTEFIAPDSLAPGDYPIMVMTDSGLDTIIASWRHFGNPTVWFLPTRTDIDNAVFFGDTLDITVQGLPQDETATIAIGGIPCPWVGVTPAADSHGRIDGKIRVPLGLVEGDYPVTATTKAAGHGISDSLLHFRNWIRLEPEVLLRSSWSGARIKEEWCYDWIRHNDPAPWGRIACYVLTGNGPTSYVNLPFWAPSGGTFQAAYFFGNTVNGAIVTMEINGESSLVEHDLYEYTLYQSWVRSDTVWGGTHTLNPGYNLLTMRTVGINPSSIGWKAVLDQVLFVATEPDPAPVAVEHVRIVPIPNGITLHWSPVNEDVEGNPIVPFAYDIFSALPDDTIWVWQAETFGSDSSWTCETLQNGPVEFAVAARLGTNLPASSIRKRMLQQK